MLIALLAMFPPALPVANACGACEEYHPWIHHPPTEEELNSAVTNFKNDFIDSLEAVDPETITVAEIWYFRVHEASYKEKYDTYEYILCLGIAGLYSPEETDYFYTSLAKSENNSFYFRPAALGPYNSREELNSYLESYIFRKPLDSNNIEQVEWINLPEQYTSVPIYFHRNWIVGLVIAFGIANYAVFKIRFAKKNKTGLE